MERETKPVFNLPEQEVEHIAHSFVHSGFDPDSPLGGCSCKTCGALREKIRTIRKKEAEEYAAQYYPPRKERGSQTAFGLLR
jgi:hypothetical protein